MNISNSILAVGDEESFLSYEEKVVYNLQKTLRSKDGMVHFAVMDLCAKLEDLIYYESLKQYNLSSATNVWSKSECINYYINKCELVLRNLETKSLNWRTIVDNANNPKLILQMLADENDRRGQISSTSNNRNKSKKKTDNSGNNSRLSLTMNKSTTNNAKSNVSNSNNIYAFNETNIQSNNQGSNNIEEFTDITVPDNLCDPLLTENSFDDFGFDFSNDDSAL